MKMIRCTDEEKKPQHNKERKIFIIYRNVCVIFCALNQLLISLTHVVCLSPFFINFLKPVYYA